ncbi:MAG TPA: type IV pilus assembly protein PilM [Chthoniobacterales bacterium]
MAAPTKYYALNLGMQTISLAEFHATAGGGLILHAFKQTELIVDPSADATRSEQVRLAVEELRTALRVKKGETVNYALPSQSVFTRFVRLPGANAEDVRSVIGFEAQQNVPFPIDEVVWDYQIMGKPRDDQWDVVLVAIKSDQLTNLNAAVEAAGLKAGYIDVAPMAIYNAFRFNQSDAAGTSLLIDIGSRTTNLIFIEGQKVFSRSIPIGGNTISAAIAKELGEEITFAEKLKLEKGFVGLGGAYAEPDDAMEAKISKLVRNTLTRLHAEITRSISFYRANQGGTQPVRAVLCGGTVSFPYMAEFFSEKLQFPVEFLNPLRNVTAANEAVASEVAGKTHTLGELVGLGLRNLRNCPMEINLRPASVIRQQDLARRKPYLIAALVTVSFALIATSLYFQRASEILADVVQKVQSDTNRLKQLAAQTEAALAERGKLEKAAAPLLLAIDERVIWNTLLDELGAYLPPKFIWITQLTPLSQNGPVAIEPGKMLGSGASSGPVAPAKPGTPPPKPATIDAIELQGLYLDIPENAQQAVIIDTFVENLTASGLFEIDPENKAKYVLQRTQPDGQSWAYGYTLRLPLKKPISLQ